MKYIDLTLPTPEENLACDEALLEWCEKENPEEILRFWQPEARVQPGCFAVVGYSNQVGQEVNVEACREFQVPIFRRCSGGGTVLQGPGCLNYALFLKIENWPGLETISGTNKFIMQKQAQAVASLLQAGCVESVQNRETGVAIRRVEPDESSRPASRSQVFDLASNRFRERKVEVQGHTDLAIGGLKISGNAQRRKRNWLLFHGTFLLSMDLERIERYLRFPSKEPSYRRGRSHREFVANLEVDPASIKEALKKTWKAFQAASPVATRDIQHLVETKYSQHDWNWKF